MGKNLIDLQEMSDLQLAVHEGDVARVKQLLTEKCPVNTFDEIGCTPLHYAAKDENLEIMQLLLEAGADANASDQSKFADTPLRAVASNCSYEVAKLLIDNGADPTIPGGMMITALQKAQARKKPEGLKVKELLERAAKNPSQLR